MKNRILSIFASFLILLSMTVVPAVAAPSGLQIFENDFFTTSGDEYVQGEFIVKFKPDIGKNKIAEINSKNGASIKRAGPHFMTLNVPQGQTVSQIVESYSRNPNVEYAEPNYIASAHMTPNDYYYGIQWHLDIPKTQENPEWHGTNGGGINIEPAWDIATGTGVIVAVIDTGVAYEDYEKYTQAPDLATTNFVQGHDYVNNDTRPNDDEGHGTHVAGTIAQSTNNSIGVAGVAFDCSIMPIKVLDNTGSGTYIWIADGIRYAADNGAQVISMSLGGTSPSETLEDALEYAYDKGVTIVCSAGNDGARANKPSYPAAYDEYCIAVGATRYDETVSYYSTTGDYVDIAAPGGDIKIDQNGDGYGDGILQQTHNGIDYTTFGYYFYQGTSMAAPHVSGVAALLISNDVTGPDNVREAMESTAEKKGFTGQDPAYGWGIVDACAALLFTQGPKPPVADAGFDQTLNDADNNMEEAVTLDASASYDPDGNIVEYEWNLDDGTVLGNTTVMTYNFTVGTHTVTLIVTDDEGLTNTDEVLITVEPKTEEPTNLMFIDSIEMIIESRDAGRNTFTLAEATVTIVDSIGNPVTNAVVSGSWSGITTDTDVGTTNDLGVVIVKSNNIKSPTGTLSGTFTFTVTDVVLDGLEYAPTEQDFGSITVPVP